jgi:signal transduction histidine kinase
MVREALDHACRHGGRSLVVGASAADGMLEISVADEGPGLSGPAVPGADAPALGLRILAYRARTIGAQLAFEAGPGAGSRVRIRHPLEARQVPGAT